MNKERLEGPFDGADLVIYTTDADDAESDPKTEWGQALGVVSYSLWARFEDEGIELPIYAASETGAWLSLSSENFHPDPATPVSDAFVRAIVNMVDEDTGDGWGDPTRPIFEAMSAVERQLFGAVQWGFLQFEADEAALVIDRCQKRHMEGDADG